MQRIGGSLGTPSLGGSPLAGAEPAAASAVARPPDSVADDGMPLSGDVSTYGITASVEGRFRHQGGTVAKWSSSCRAVLAVRSRRRASSTPPSAARSRRASERKPDVSSVAHVGLTPRRSPLHHAAVEVGRMTARDELARADRAPGRAHRGGVIIAIDEIGTDGDGAGLRQVFEPCRQAERALVEDDGPAMIIQGG